MNKKKKSFLLAGTVILTLAASFGTMEIPSIASGKTEISLGVSQLAPEAVSFEIPLYLTMCVTNDKGTNTVIVPSDPYCIKNANTGIPMAVTGLRVTGAAGGDWTLVNEFTPGTTGKEIRLSVGGVMLPGLAAGSSEEKAADLTKAESSFYDYTNKRFKRIGEDDTVNQSCMVLPVEAFVPDGYVPVDQAGPTAQFRLKYTVSCIDSEGTIMDKDYVGPGRADAARTP